jgi:hypothetical protein
MSKFVNKKGKLRLYDGTATAFFLELDFDLGDFSGPLGIPKTEEILVLNRGNADADAHYIEGNDDKIMEPFPITFSAFVVDKTQCKYLLDWLEAMEDGGGSPAVNSNTLVTTKEDTQRDGSNNSPAFADSTKMTSNLEYKLDGTTDICWHYNEVLFALSEQVISEAEDGVPIALNGMVYGTVVRDAAFSAGATVE